MTELVVRRLLIDLQQPFDRRWCGGDAFRTAFFNALSMSFPLGEQFFIDSVRTGLKSLPDAERERFAGEVQGFIGQEATRRRIQAHAHRNLRMHLASTAATEHFTAVFADWLLRHPQVLDGAEPRLKALWLWHSAEESEHRCTAFDLHRAAGGNEVWRLRTYRYVTVIFLSDMLRQTVRNLWHDGSLFRWSTWRSAGQVLFAKDGLIRGNIGRWRDYLSPDFHPSQHDASLSQRWLADNAHQFAVVGARA